MKNKKGAIEGLMALITPLVGIGIVIVVGFLIVAEVQTQVENVQGLNTSGGRTADLDGTAAHNATEDVQNALADIPGWLPIIVITVIGALLIGLVTRFRAMR